MKKLAVIGPGLLGGSLAFAVRAWPDWEVAVWARRSAAVEELKALGLEASHDLAAVAAEADLVVLCVPIGAMPALAAELARIIPPHAVVTDVGSVKAPVVETLTPLFTDRGCFIGSHPMAGSEQSGLKAARADLFKGSVCLVTPVETSPPEAVAKVEAFWQSVGCRVLRLSPGDHDAKVALVSHLPHLLAAVLVNMVHAEEPAAFAVAGPGFRDTTRVAGGPPEMWTEILGANRESVKKWTEAMIAKLRESVTLLDQSPQDGGTPSLMNEFLARAKAERDRLRLPR